MKPNMTLKALVVLSFLLFTTLVGRSALAAAVTQVVTLEGVSLASPSRTAS